MPGYDRAEGSFGDRAVGFSPTPGSDAPAGPAPSRYRRGPRSWHGGAKTGAALVIGSVVTWPPVGTEARGAAPNRADACPWFARPCQAWSAADHHHEPEPESPVG